MKKLMPFFLFIIIIIISCGIIMFTSKLELNQKIEDFKYMLAVNEVETKNVYINKLKATVKIESAEEKLSYSDIANIRRVITIIRNLGIEEKDCEIIVESNNGAVLASHEFKDFGNKVNTNINGNLDDSMAFYKIKQSFYNNSIEFSDIFFTSASGDRNIYYGRTLEMKMPVNFSEQLVISIEKAVSEANENGCNVHRINIGFSDGTVYSRDFIYSDNIIFNINSQE